MGAAPSGQRFYNSLLHRGLGSLGPQWYGLDVVCAKPHLRGWKVRNGTPGEAENRVQPDDQPDELDFIRALAAEIRFVVAAADIDSADGDGLPDKDSSTGSSTGRDGIGRDAAVRSGTSVGAKVKLRGRDRYGSTDRVPGSGGSEGVTLGVRCAGYAAVSSLGVGLVVTSLVGSSMRAMEPSER